jgi:hypothetical protein
MANVPSTTSANSAVPVSTIVRQEGAGKAYQSVAQSTAIAIQDATDNLRNINTISSTAMGVAMAQFLATGEPQYAQAMEYASKMSADAASTFLLIGTNASDVLKGYPSGQ